ncbi:MAG TPA: hypothetical protein VFK52_06735 [Nocardioidaceae bacterium]|nr:hypothetical protein [Nocardioidaceae bacterium]
MQFADSAGYATLNRGRDRRYCTSLRVARCLVVATLSVVAGCGGGVDDEGGRPAPLTYDTWKPVYADARPATEADIEELYARAAASKADSWTAQIDGLVVVGKLADGAPAELPDLSIEMANTDSHLRYRFTSQTKGTVEFHLGLTPRGPYLVRCTEVSCLALPSSALSSPSDPYAFWLGKIMLTQRMTFHRSDGEPESAKGSIYATVGSPIGELDCIVWADEGVTPSELDGTPVSLDPDEWLGHERVPLARCVDEHGLAVVTKDLTFPVLRYTSFEEGVDGDITAYPFPVAAAP